MSFQTTQQQFATYIRTPRPELVPPNVKPERMAVYRELFFNNVDSFLSSGFPVLKRILTAAQWQELVEDFFANHHNKTPYFSEIAEEFLEFLQNERDNPADYPFLLELAHYEWVEMALAISIEQPPPFTEYIDDFRQQKISLSPVAWHLAYRYQVQQISPQFLPLEPPAQPTYLIVYRDWHDEVHFMQITAVIFRLLQIVEENSDFTVAMCLQQLADELPAVNPEQIQQGGLQALLELFNKSIVSVV